MLLRLMKNNLLFSLGVTICCMWIIVAVIAPLITPYDYLAQDLANRF